MRYRLKQRSRAAERQKASGFRDGQNAQVEFWLPYGSYDEAAEPLLVIESPDLLAWGVIPDCLAPFPHAGRIPGGEIVVPKGDRSFGLAHIIEKHQHKFAELNGGISVLAYVADVLRHYQRVYKQADGSLWLIRENGIRKCAIVAPFTLRGSPAYKLITAYPLPREPNFARRQALKLVYAG